MAFYTAAQLRSDCKIALQAYNEFHHHKHVNTHLESGNCIGFITGVIETHNLQKTISGSDVTPRSAPGQNKEHFCLPANISMETIIKEIISDLNDHPDILKFSAIVVILDILKVRYPCDTTIKKHLKPNEM